MRIPARLHSTKMQELDQGLVDDDDDVNVSAVATKA